MTKRGPVWESEPAKPTRRLEPLESPELRKEPPSTDELQRKEPDGADQPMEVEYRPIM